MHLTLEQKTKDFLKKYNIRPSKKLGQNFLINETILAQIIQASHLTKNDVVLEIGPGLGILTQELASAAKRVMAIEKDNKLAVILKQKLPKYRNIEISQGDILKNYKLPTISYKLVANLPYNIALPIIRKFVEEKNPPQEMILMLQKEVAQKICAQKSSLPKIAIELYAKTKILFYVPKESFWPMPKVDGAVIKIFDIQKNVPKIDKDLFFKILKAGFAHPRKTILNNLSKKLGVEKEKTISWLEDSKINPKKRAEDLDLKNWLTLAQNFNKL
jgi:16S rRNA (adenine1518-N6/adenine1519-N6)-dimethyltransferase